MARRAGLRGLAVGMDVDAGALAVAQAAAARVGVRARFVRADAAHLGAGVEAAARDPGTVFHQAHVHQVWGRRAQ